MTKQKFVVKLSLEDAKKRTKAFKTAVTMNGLVSITLDGDKLVVVGDGTDPVIMTALLRKKLGYADLISVASAEEKNEEKKDDKKENKPQSEYQIVHPPVYPYQHTYSYPHTYQDGIYDNYKCYMYCT